MRFNIGDRVDRIGPSYMRRGIVVATFANLDGVDWATKYEVRFGHITAMCLETQLGMCHQSTVDRIPLRISMLFRCFSRVSECGECGSLNVRRSKRRGLLERTVAAVGVVPWRCRACKYRFLALRSSFALADNDNSRR